MATPVQTLRSFLYDQVKTHCKTDLQKKFFIDRCGFDYCDHYMCTEDDIKDRFGRGEMINLYINDIMSDTDVEITLNNMMEIAIQNDIAKVHTPPKIPTSRSEEVKVGSLERHRKYKSRVVSESTYMGD